MRTAATTDGQLCDEQVNSETTSLDELDEHDLVMSQVFLVVSQSETVISDINIFIVTTL